jgi:hypothetical protein
MLQAIIWLMYAVIYASLGYIQPLLPWGNTIRALRVQRTRVPVSWLKCVAIDYNDQEIFTKLVANIEIQNLVIKRS